jgi:ABC-type xylose transport system substrate-binding protein
MPALPSEAGVLKGGSIRFWTAAGALNAASGALTAANGALTAVAAPNEGNAVVAAALRKQKQVACK